MSCPDMPLAAVHNALRHTTEFLARELAAPGELAPSWAANEWLVAQAVVSIHGVSGLLAGRLRWRGPPEWQPFLQDQHTQIGLRQARIAGLLQRIDAAARARSLALVALKGAALQARGLYAAGERPMADLDLLVSEAQAPRAAQMFLELGFRAGPVTWKHRVFEPEPVAGEAPAALGESGMAPIKVELHGLIRELLPLRPVDISHLVLAPPNAAGVNDYPSTAALLLHVLLHAAGTMIGRSLRLLHLNDIARLAQRMTPADWDAMFALAADTADPSLWWTFPPLALTQRYYRCIPPAVLARVAEAAGWRLRRCLRARTLSDVSLSYLWVSAFPGIEWSRSSREFAAYAAERVRPSAETLALRQEYAVAQPQVSGGEWAYTSQGRRIVRWLLARQPRHESLQPVRTVFARAGRRSA